MGPGRLAGTALIVARLSALGFAGLASAQPPTVPAGPVTPALQADPVVVTATRTPVAESELSESVTVILREEIEARQVTDLVELLRGVPGINVAAGARGTVAVADARGGSETFNLIFVDGVKINDAQAFYTLATLTTDNVERIEIVRGPLSALYGADAMSAVVQIFTRRGRGQPGGEVSFGAGNQDTFEESGALAGGVGPWGYSLAVGRIDGDNHLPVNSGFHQTTFSARGDLQGASGFDTTVTVRYTDSRSDVPTAGPDRFQPLDPTQSLLQTRLILGARVGHAVTSAWQQGLQLGFQRYTFDIRDPRDPEVDVVGFRSDSTEERFSLDYTWNLAAPTVLDVSTLLTFGLSYEHDRADLRTTFTDTPDPGGRTVSQETDIVGLYLQAQANWRSRLFLTAGVRADWLSEHGQQTSPRASAAYLFRRAGTKIRAGYGEGFKAPSFIQSFGDGSPFVIGNPDLAPERSRSWEVGLDQSLVGDRVEVSATYFDARYEDLIALVLGGDPSFVSVREATARGVEAAVRVRPWTGVALSGTYTYLDTEVVDTGGAAPNEFPIGAPLLRRPRNLGSLALDWAPGRFASRVTALFVGDSEDTDPRTLPAQRVRLPGYTRIDLAASYVLLRERWWLRELTLFGRVLNLLDADYEEAFGVTAPGRTFLIGLRGHF
jgi:vitamin B12 transporter